MSGRIITGISASYSGPTIAIAHSDGSVTIWNIQTSTKISHFESYFETGGRRLAISDDGELCAVGAYHRHGIVLHKVVDGRMIWQRKDLRKVQTLTFSPQYDDVLVACFDNKSCHVLNVGTGETITTMKGVRRFKRSPFNRLQLLVKARAFELFNHVQSRSIGRIRMASFAVLDAAFTENSVVVAESAGPIRCFDCDETRLMWQYTPEPGSHILSLGYRKETQEVLGVCWSYTVGGDSTLLAFDKNIGEINSKYVLKDLGGESTFAFEGKWLIHNTGVVINTSDGTEVTKLFED